MTFIGRKGQSSHLRDVPPLEPWISVEAFVITDTDRLAGLLDQKLSNYRKESTLLEWKCGSGRKQSVAWQGEEQKEQQWKCSPSICAARIHAQRQISCSRQYKWG